MLEKQEKETAFQKLSKLIGMECFKREIQLLEYSGVESINNLHYIITGNPGTGKTTIARLLGEILHELGYLRSGHIVMVTRSDLVGAFVGEATIKTKGKIGEATGGVLFIDEANTLFQSGEDHFGHEAMVTLVKEAWGDGDRKKQFVMILSCYPEQIDAFLQLTPGLKQKLRIIHLNDYSTEEMVKILQNFAGDFILEPEYIQKTKQIFDFWTANKDRNFGNAGDVRKYFSECNDTLYKRLFKEYEVSSDIPEEVKKTLTGQDIPSKYLLVVGGLASECNE